MLIVLMRVAFQLYEFISYVVLGRGWRPSYRDVLLTVRKKLNVPCSTKLSSEDLEAEIFLHLLQEYSRYFTEACILYLRFDHLSL